MSVKKVVEKSPEPSSNTILIVGANAGLGKECARQLGLRPETKKVILGCRNPTKAHEAQMELIRLTGCNEDVFETLHIDIMDLDSIQNAVDEVKKSNVPIDGLILNAGGIGNPETAVQVTDADGDDGSGAALNIVKLNVLGHVYLVNRLIQANVLRKGGATIIFVGSRSAARGHPSFGIPKPELPDGGTVTEFTSFIDGTNPFYTTYPDVSTYYCCAKLLGALWVGSMAKRYPQFRFVTICPGMTAGTNQFENFPWKQWLMYSALLKMFAWTGKAQRLEVGAAKFVTALYNSEEYQTGIFYARDNATGKDMVDQVCNNEIFHNESAQDHCREAIHKFLPNLSRPHSPQVN